MNLWAMILLGLVAWTVAAFPFAVFIGSCIRFGMGGEDDGHRG